MKQILVASALIRRADEILLVHNGRPGARLRWWSLPGGRVEHTEMLNESLVREIREETGLKIHEPFGLAMVIQSRATRPRRVYTSCVFDVPEWEGEIAPNDPDDKIQECVFCSPDRARELLNTNRHPAMYEPVLHYLASPETTPRYWNFEPTPGDF